MKVVSITLARGGSKGIPRKNLVPLSGKPLLYYRIRNAKLSNVVETWVSTDDDEIKQVAKYYGAQVIDRPIELSLDSSKCETALLHFANNVEFDYLVFLQNTSPLVLPEDINRGIELVTSGKYDSVFSGYREHWTGRWTLENEPMNWDPRNRPRRQDVKENYVENGAFYVTSRDNLLTSELRYSGNIGVVEMPFSRSFQIDTLDEVKIIERLIGIC